MGLLGEQSMSKARKGFAAWCLQGGSLNAPPSPEADGRNACPRCGRRLRVQIRRDYSAETMRGWSGLRWPRHYSWADNMKTGAA